MKRVYLNGQNEYLELEDDEYDEYQRQLQDQSSKMVQVGNKSIHKSKIRKVDEKKKIKRYTLENDKKLAIDFDQEIENLKKKKLTRDVSYFGIPKIKEEKFKNGYTMQENPNRVYNSILGLIDARIVEYCLDKKMICRFNSKQWGVGQNIDGYVDFQAKMDLRNDLLETRGYARKMELQGLDKVATETIKPIININEMAKAKEVRDISTEEIPL